MTNIHNLQQVLTRSLSLTVPKILTSEQTSGIASKVLSALFLSTLFGTQQAAADENLWVKWLLFQDDSRKKSLIIDCKYKETITDSFKISKTLSSGLSLSVLENQRWVVKSGAIFSDSNVTYHVIPYGPLYIFDYFGWERDITQEFFSDLYGKLPTPTVRSLKKLVEDRERGEHVIEKIRNIIDDHVSIEDFYGATANLNFRSRKLLTSHRLKVEKDGELSYKIFRRKPFDGKDYTVFLEPIYEIENFETKDFIVGELLHCVAH